MKRIKTEIVYLKYQGDWARLDINFGSVIFKTSKGKIYIDETPYGSNETLSQISNLILDVKGFLQFNIHSHKGKIIQYNLDCNTINGAIELAKCLINVHQNGLMSSDTFNDIEIKVNQDIYVSIDSHKINHYGLKVHSLLKQTKVCLGGNTELNIT